MFIVFYIAIIFILFYVSSLFLVSNTLVSASDVTPEPGLMKIRIILRQKNPKTHGIDTQKWTLAFICYAHFWRAYNMQFSRAYDTKFVGVHMICSFRVHMIRIYTTTLTLPIA